MLITRSVRIFATKIKQCYFWQQKSRPVLRLHNRLKIAVDLQPLKQLCGDALVPSPLPAGPHQPPAPRGLCGCHYKPRPHLPPQGTQQHMGLGADEELKSPKAALGFWSPLGRRDASDGIPRLPAGCKCATCSIRAMETAAPTRACMQLAPTENRQNKPHKKHKSKPTCCNFSIKF